jgi:LPXTG-site transpeptidase (sortase) family protein
VVDPTDVWVTEPVEGKENIVSLQTCYPEPTFEKRLIVRAELIDGGEGHSAVSGG